MKTKQELQEEKKQRELQLKALKQETKYNEKMVKVEEKKVKIDRRWNDLTTKKAPPEFSGRNFLIHLIANASANNFKKIDWKNTNKEIQNILIDNHFENSYTRANYIASKYGYSGLMAYQSKDKKKTIIECGKLDNLQFLENELEYVVFHSNSEIDFTHNYGIWEWKKDEEGVVSRRRFRNASHFKQEIESNEWEKTTYTRIPVAVSPNNSTFTPDSKYSEPLFEYFEKTLGKIWDDMDFGGNKLALQEDIIAYKNGLTRETILDDLIDQIRGPVVMIPTKNIGSMPNRFTDNQANVEINAYPLNSADLTKYLETIKSLVWQASGLPEGKGKNAAQETDSQVANINKMQNDSVEVKASLREQALKEFIRIIEMVKDDKELVELKLYELDLEIELSANQEMQLGNGANGNGGKPNESKQFKGGTAPTTK